jgi:hypothetical protein
MRELKPLEETLHQIPPPPFLLKIKTEKQQKRATQKKKDSLVQACKVRANLTLGKEV